MIKNIIEFIKVVIISLIIILPIRYFIIQPFYVKGASMEPNFHDREYLIIDEISYRFNQPERGQVIVFRYPLNPQEYFIKRIIALPGEKVEINDGDIYIFNAENPQGFLLEEKTYLSENVKTYAQETETEIITLKDDEFFVLGDNRYSSKDSRVFGPLKKDFIIGRVIFRGWPFSRFTIFKYKSLYQY